MISTKLCAGPGVEVEPRRVHTQPSRPTPALWSDRDRMLFFCYFVTRTCFHVNS